MKICPPDYTKLSFLDVAKPSTRHLVPNPRTDEEKLNPYWPNCTFNGNGFVGLGECTRQMNRGDLDEFKTIEIESALKHARIYLGKRQVSMYIPGVCVEYPFCNLKSEVATVGSVEKITREQYPHICIHNVEFYWKKKPEPQPQFTMDNMNRDFSHYPSLLVLPYRKDEKLLALVSLSKIWFEWSDHTSYGWAICHEFITDLVKSGHYYRLGV
jgi:hypothetical protein